MKDPNNELTDRDKSRLTSFTNSNSPSPENSSQSDKIAQTQTGEPLIDFLIWGATVLGGLGSIFQSNSTPQKPTNSQTQPVAATNQNGCPPEGSDSSDRNIDEVSTESKMSKGEKQEFKTYVKDLQRMGKERKGINTQAQPQECLSLSEIKAAATKLIALKSSNKEVLKTIAGAGYPKYGKEALKKIENALIDLEKFGVDRTKAVKIIQEVAKNPRDLVTFQQSIKLGNELLRSGKITNPKGIGETLNKIGQAIKSKTDNGYAYELEVAAKEISKLKPGSKGVQIGAVKIGTGSIKVGADVVNHETRQCIQAKNVFSADEGAFSQNFNKAIEQLSKKGKEKLVEIPTGSPYGKVVDLKISNKQNKLYNADANKLINNIVDKESIKTYTGTVRITNGKGVLEVEIKNGKVVTPKDKIIQRSSTEEQTDTSITASTNNGTDLDSQSTSQTGDISLGSTSATTTNDRSTQQSPLANGAVVLQNVTGLTQQSSLANGAVLLQNVTGLTQQSSLANGAVPLQNVTGLTASQPQQAASSAQMAL